jgi:hypothetical protein
MKALGFVCYVVLFVPAVISGVIRLAIGTVVVAATLVIALAATLLMSPFVLAYKILT